MKHISWILLLFSTLSFAQNAKKVDLSNPNATIYTHIYFLQEDSYQPDSSATAIYGYEGEAAVDIAVKLKKILDGKGLRVDFNKIPTDPQFSDTTGYTVGHKFVLFPYQMPQIYLERIGNQWYYSRETTESIDALYKSVFPWHIDKIKNLIPEVGHKKVFGIELWQYLGLILLILISTVFFYIIRRVVYFILKKLQYWIIHRSNDKINEALKKLARPIVFLIIIWFFQKLLPSFSLPLHINTWLFLGLNIMVTVFWIYVFLKLVQVVMSIYAEFAESTHSKLDDQLVPILHNFLSGVVIFLGLLKVLTLFGIEPVTVIAGASIGGLAVALASQDTVKNLIGTVMIFVDKPFHIGDWIEAGEVVGTVEAVGFRSTMVRAADTSIYQIPNSKLAEMVVNNKGLRAYRRYTTQLGVRYDTPPELIEAFVVGIRKLIEQHPETRDDAFNVEFSGFGDSSLNIMLNTYFTSLEWGKEQSSKHDLHMKILKLATALGVDFAFPSSTVMIEQFPDKSNVSPKYDTDKGRIDKIISEL